MTTRFRGVVPWVGAAILTGAAASVIPTEGLAVLVGALAVWLVVVLMSARSGAGRTWHPAVMLLTGLAIVAVAFNGVPISFTNVPDVLLLGAVAAVGLCWLQGTLEVPIPGWLLGSAALLLAGELVATLVVPDPPLDPAPSFTPIESPVVAVAKTEFGLLVVPIVIGAVASSWRRVDLLANLWVASATASCAVAVFDAVTGMGIGLSITGSELFEASREGGLALHPNHLALASVMALPVVLHRIVHPRHLGRVAWVAASLVLIAGVLVSGSRINLLAVFVAVGLTAVLIARLRGRVIAAGIAIIVVTLTVLSLVPGLTEQFVGIDRLGGGGNANLATAARSSQLQESLDIALDYPITGVGFSVITDAHNLPVQYWESAGLLGLLSLILYSTGAVTTGLRLYRDRRLPPGVADLAGALTVSFSIWVIAGLFQSQLGDRYIYVPVGLLIGLQLAAKNWKPEPGKDAESDPADSVPEQLPVSRPAAAARVPAAP